MVEASSENRTCGVTGANGKLCGLPIDDGHAHGTPMCDSEEYRKCQSMAWWREDTRSEMTTVACDKDRYPSHTKHHDPEFGDWEVGFRD